MDILAAAIAWRRARQAVMADPLNSELWTKLSKAESYLDRLVKESL